MAKVENSRKRLRSKVARHGANKASDLVSGNSRDLS